MTCPQTIENIPLEALLDKVRALRDQGFRPVQISATRLPECVELTYSFDRKGSLTSLRLQLPSEAPRVPSISSIFACVILYENEMHDLFNIQVDGMAVDFHGNLYKTAVKFPFGTTKLAASKPAPAPAAASKPAQATVSPPTVS